MREGSSPSYFNPDEVSTIHGYVRALRENQKLRLSVYTRGLVILRADSCSADDHIGVISPYNAQCRKIRALLAKSSFAPKVGSTEQFQGQVSIPCFGSVVLRSLNMSLKERRVILVSTVRSKTELVSFDIKHTLGMTIETYKISRPDQYYALSRLGFVANPRRFNGRRLTGLRYCSVSPYTHFLARTHSRND
jgi:helicase MOV-10